MKLSSYLQNLAGNGKILIKFNQKTQILLSGWKDICTIHGVKDKRTMKKRILKYKIPVKYINGRPQISIPDLIKFYSNLQN